MMCGVWRGNFDSVGHLCVWDAQLTSQDAWLKPTTQDDHSSDHSTSQRVVCAIHNCNDSQQTLHIALQSRARRCVAGVWRGNADSIGHVCVPDAQLPCQDACLKPMTQDDHSSGHSISRRVVCAIYNCNDSQQTLDLALQSRVRRCVAGVWRGNVDSVGHLCVPDAQLPCQDAWLKPMTRDDHSNGYLTSRLVVCAIHNCNDSQQTLDIALQYRARRCVAGVWRGNIDSIGHLCVRDAQLPCQDA
jgi:hypothetical protein